jgi:hypothetical protein
MMRMWRLFALAVLLLGISGVARLYWGGFAWKSGLSNDAIVVLFVGLMAFLAVMIQIEEDRTKRFEDQESEKKAVATALLFEIDGFYATYLRQPRDLLMRKDVAKDALPRFASIGPNQFPIYCGNASKIGDLLTDCVLGAVGFVRVADSILSNLIDYASSLERAQQAGRVVTGDADFATIIDFRGPGVVARIQLGRIKDVLPEAIKAAYLVCHALCQFAGVPFEYPRVTVAAEGASVNEIGASLSAEHGGSSSQSTNAKKN